MRLGLRSAISIALGLAALVAGCGDDDAGGNAADRGGAGVTAGGADAPRFSTPTRITNPYLPLSLYKRCVLEGEEDGERARTVRRLLTRTQPFKFGDRSVATLVIEDRSYQEGKLVERTLDYFAQSDEGTVYYFGEDVDDIENGRVTGHGGQWRYGRDTQRLGVAMPARPTLGSTWRFEDVPGITVESNRLAQKIPEARINGRTYRDLIRVREVLDPSKEVEHKVYARGVGLVREVPPEGRVELVGCQR